MRVFPLIAFLAAAVFVALGIWQLDRLDQRRARSAAIRARMAHPPVALGSDTVPADSLPFRRARVRGVFDLERQVIVVARSRRGVPGVHVVTPLRRLDEPAILVERGWVPSPDGKTVRLSALVEPETTAVVGVLLDPPERRRLATGRHDLAAVRSRAGTRGAGGDVAVCAGSPGAPAHDAPAGRPRGVSGAGAAGAGTGTPSQLCDPVVCVRGDRGSRLGGVDQERTGRAAAG